MADFAGGVGSILESEGSALLINCNGVSAADPGEVLAGLRELPSGVERANAGIYGVGVFGSGVRGDRGGITGVCESSFIEEELIHFSSFEPMRGEESDGNNRNKSAKWSLINLKKSRRLIKSRNEETADSFLRKLTLRVLPNRRPL